MFERADLVVLVVYLAAMLAIALWVSRGSRDVEGYTVGNRSLAGWVVGCSVLGTFLSSITFLTLPEQAFTGDWNVYVFGLALPLAALVAVRWFVPLYRRGGRLSAYELLEERFGYWARLYGDVSYIVLQMIRVGTVLLLVGLAVEPLVDWQPLATGSADAADPAAAKLAKTVAILLVLGVLVIVYDTLGGIQAVIWTDVVQVGILLIGVGWVLAVIVGSHPGGAGNFLADLKPEKISLGPWLNWNDAGRWDWAISSVLVVFIYGLSENLRNYGADQNYVQRMLAARSDQAARRAIWLAALAYLPISLVFCLIGTGLYMHYNQPGNVLPEGIKAVEVFPYFIKHELPKPVAGLVIAALLAAAMSTIDSSLNSCSTVLLADVVRRLRRGPPRVPEIVTVRCLTVLLGVVGTGTAVGLLIALGQEEARTVLQMWWRYAGTAGGGLFGLFLLAWLMPRIPTWGAATAVVLTLPVLAWGTFARDLSPEWQWLTCPLHPNLVGVSATAAMLLVGGLLVAAVRLKWIDGNQRVETTPAG